MPVKEKFRNKLEYEEVLKVHMEARVFEKGFKSRDNLYGTSPSCRNFHVLGFRGFKLPMDFVVEYVNVLLFSERIIKVPVTSSHVQEALKLSRESGIHIWDFLCIVPIREYLDRIYTVDKYFLHETFQKLGIKIENPLEILD
ncbi:MAG: hypothetical protein ACTSXW_02670 [Candidatus Baldrarchaeia archaeon]